MGVTLEAGPEHSGSVGAGVCGGTWKDCRYVVSWGAGNGDVRGMGRGDGALGCAPPVGLCSLDGTPPAERVGSAVAVRSET